MILLRDKTVGSRPDRRLTFCPDGNKKVSKKCLAPAVGMAWRVGSVNCWGAESRSVLSCTSASVQGRRFSFCRGCINISVKGFWFEKPGSQARSTATAI